METFEFYQDQKVTTWDRVHFSITAPDLETAKAKLEAYRDEQIDNNESLGIEISHCEYQPDTSESMTVEENGGCSTLEMYTKDGAAVMNNAPKPLNENNKNYQHEEVAIMAPRSIWMRLGVSVFGNAEEIDKILNGEQPQLIKLLREGKFEIYGDTYIPDTSVDDYNQTNGTHYDPLEVEFSLSIKSAELLGKTITGTSSSGHLSQNETIVRICPDTKLPVLVCYEGEERCLCLHNDSTEADKQAIDNWLSSNGITDRKFNICPRCLQDTLKYAMIDVDGTNLEEGYSCSECGANFIGLDNEQVIEFNPEITTDDE